MFEAHIEANMYDEDTAQFLSEDAGWLQSQWPEARRQAIEDGKTVTGNPSLKEYNFEEEVEDGLLYDFVFNVPTA